jgi:hypothetical protein
MANRFNFFLCTLELLWDKFFPKMAKFCPIWSHLSQIKLVTNVFVTIAGGVLVELFVVVMSYLCCPREGRSDVVAKKIAQNVAKLIFHQSYA